MNCFQSPSVVRAIQRGPTNLSFVVSMFQR